MVVPNSYTKVSDFRNHGDRRKTERRGQESDRRGILRWDPNIKDRRAEQDRRDGFSGKTRRS